MRAFKIENDDLIINDSGEFEFVSDADDITQCVQRILTTNKNEWFLNTEMGLDYSSIRGKHKTDEQIQLALFEAIHQEERVRDILNLNIERNNFDRKLYIDFTFVTNEGDIIEGREEIV